jgi:Flp pilus assembly protein TadD
MSAAAPVQTPVRLALLAGIALSAAALSGCAGAQKPTPQEKALVSAAEAKSILPATQEERDAADRMDLLSQATFWGKEYDKNPNDYETALKLARVLRAIGSSQRATEVASQALNLKQGDVELSLVFAQASLDEGRPQDAATVLAQAEAAGKNDWRMMSIIGVTMDQLDQHAPAQDYYRKALALSPNNPKVLSNLGLSYALANKPALAEETLRKAAAEDADARVHQNLALVLGVQGKFAEAEKAVSPDTPKELVDSNAAYFHALLTPARKWDSVPLRGSQN